MLILASVAYLMAGRPLQEAAERREAKAAPGSGRVQPAPIQFQLSARYAVGVGQFPGLFRAGTGGAATAPATSSPATHPTTASATTVPEPRGRPAAGDSTAAGLLEQVDEAAAASGSPHDLLRAAVIAGEVAGADAAVRRIDVAAPQGVLSPSPAADDADTLRAIYADGPDSLTPEQRDRLVRRHGWFGELALAYGKPADDPQRRQAVRPAVRTAIAMGVAALVGLAALGTGLILLVLAIVFWSGGGLRPAYQPPLPDRPTGPFVEAFAVYLAGMIVLSLAAALVLERSPMGTWLVVGAVPFASLWPLLRGVPWGELRRGLGWTRGRGWFREIGAGLVAYLAGLPVLALAALVTFALQRLSGAETAHPIVDEFARGGGWRAAKLFLLAAVWAPLVEETMFRGAFYHSLRRRFRWPLAAVVTGLIFAAVHPQGWAAIPVLGSIGFCFAATREWRGSIIAPAVAHALNNGAITALLIVALR